MQDQPISGGTPASVIITIGVDDSTTWPCPPRSADRILGDLRRHAAASPRR
jgi:hypothetical protein